MLRHLTWLSLITAWAAGSFALWAADSTGDLPPRHITAALQYPGITIAPEDSISVDLLIKNRGRSDETVLVEVTEKPKDWDVQIKRFSTIVSGVFVASKEDQTLNLTAKPKDKDLKKLPPGNYRFAIKAKSADGSLEQTSAITVTVAGEQKAAQRVTIDTHLPDLARALRRQIPVLARRAQRHRPGRRV